MSIEAVTWYVVQSKPRQEAEAAINLKGMGYAVFLPRHWETESRNGRTRTELRPMFPGYLFAAVDPAEGQSVYAINSAIGVNRILVVSAEPVSIRTKDIWRLRRFFDPDGVLPPNPRSLKHLSKIIRTKIVPNMPGLGVADLLAHIEALDDRGRYRVQREQTRDVRFAFPARTVSTSEVPETADLSRNVGTPSADAMPAFQKTSSPKSDPRSDEALAYRAWYRTARWQRIRAEQIRDEPLCAMCARQGRVTAATVCDHVERHNGDPVKFWSGPFQSLCKPHHDRDKQQVEHRGYSSEVGADGYPIDPNHPANR